MNILLISDIHGNFPALTAVEDFFTGTDFDMICNCGDSIVYAPFPNETLLWLQERKVHSILGNTDRKVKRLLRGKNIKKPNSADKKIMYTWTADVLDQRSEKYLNGLKKSKKINTPFGSICLFHGSPDDPDEFLFPTTPISRFEELSKTCSCSVIITGHSHTPFHVTVGSTHFVNPGSVGRMFDGNPAASCAVINLDHRGIIVTPYRINYNTIKTIEELKKNNMPAIYEKMYRFGLKLN